MSHQPLAGMVALVTGGSRGIGEATALRLADDGADVAITYVSSGERARNVVSRIEERGARAEAFASDQADPDQPARLVGEVMAAFSRLRDRRHAERRRRLQRLTGRRVPGHASSAAA
jgi:3-oxoacyl-[acyl-carrier protein] reductase